MNQRLANFQGTLSETGSKRHLEFTFTCPPGAVGLELTLTFEPAEVGGIHNLLYFSIFGPDGFRGAGHRGGNEHRVWLSKDAATPGYLPGTLKAGSWRVVIHTHMVRPGEPLRYRLEVGLTDAPTAQPRSLPRLTPTKPIPPERGPGWYKGDLHAHSLHSDASWTVDDLVASAKRFSLDFVTLSDHNTVSGLPEMDALTTPELLTLGGIELTTFYGHALALGRRTWLDWVHTPMTELAERADAEGLFIIAHPRREGDPVCTGCRWEYAELLPGRAQVVEIWNSRSWDTHNEQALALWYSWLNKGHRITASAGTDGHRPALEGTQVGFNVVYAEALTEAAILVGVRRGRSYLSSGPRLELTLPDHPEPVTGDVVAAETTLSLRYEGVPADASLRLIANGEVQRTVSLADSGRLELRLPDAARWGVLELRAPDGKVLAVTNPVFTPAFATLVQTAASR